jgi:hypothetical protein
MAWIVFGLFIPKIQLNFSSALVGFRLEDFWAVLSVIFMRFATNSSVTLPRFFNGYIILYIVLIISWAYNFFITGRLDRPDSFAAVFYPLRGIEYLLFFVIGVYYTRFAQKYDIDLQKILYGFLVLQLVLSIGQILDLIPTINYFGNSRASGTMNGPYELAAIICILFFLQRKSWLYMWACIVVVVLTSSRISLIALIIAYLFFNENVSKSISRHRFAILVIIISSILILAPILISVDSEWEGGSDALLARFTGLMSLEYWGNLADISGQLLPANTAKDYYDVYEEPMGMAGEVAGDPSALMRVYRWTILFLSIFSHADSVILGLGPSFGTNAVDGFYVRLIVEGGLLACLCFIWFAYSFGRYLKHYQRELYPGFVTLLIGSLFIDIFIAYKVMLIFFFLLGAYFEKDAVGKNTLRQN